MAKFDENKVITPLHLEKAEIGKIYYFNDSLKGLKQNVESNESIRALRSANPSSNTPFVVDNLPVGYQFLYPYEEPPKRRMTNRQLAEWLAKGNGEYNYASSAGVYSNFIYNKGNENNILDSDMHIRSYDSDEWVEPTADIYERDCKKR